MLQLEKKESRIDEAIDKALDKKGHDQDLINEVFDTFLIDEIIEFLVEEPVQLRVFDSAGTDSVVLSALQYGILLDVLEMRDFLQEEIDCDLIPKYLRRSIVTLSERSDRIKFERSYDTKNSSKEFVEYVLSLKE